MTRVILFTIYLPAMLRPPAIAEAIASAGWQSVAGGRITVYYGITMSTITAIKAQKRKERYNVFLDGEFAFGIDAEVLLKEKLAVGVELSEQETERLKDRAELGKLFEKALNFLSYRPRSEREVRDYLGRKGRSKGRKSSFDRFRISASLREVRSQKRARGPQLQKLSVPPPSEEPLRVTSEVLNTDQPIEEVIEKLKNLKYIDDLDFAKWWVEQRRTSSKPRGARMIKSELFQKGVPKEIIEEALGSKDAEGEGFQGDFDLALKAAEKKLPSYRSLEPRKFRQKMGAYLARRGFEWEVVREVLAQFDSREGK